MLLDKEGASVHLALARDHGPLSEASAYSLIEDAKERLHGKLIMFYGVSIRAWELDDVLGDASVAVAKLISSGLAVEDWPATMNRLTNKMVQRWCRAAKRESLTTNLETAMLTTEEKRPDEELIRRETYEQLHEALDELHPDDRELIQMLFLNEGENQFTAREVAKLRKCTDQNISLHKQAVLKKLKALLRLRDVEVAAEWLA